MDTIRLQSKFLIASPTRILHPAQIAIREGRIVEVTESTAATADIDLGESVLLPGLVNAHTHLEFSDLQEPFKAGRTFADWISTVIDYRRTRHLDPASPEGQLPVRLGLAECFSGGTALIADIITPPWHPRFLPTAAEFTMGKMPRSPRGAPQHSLSKDDWRRHLAPIAHPRVMPLAEMIGLKAERLDESCRWATRLVEEASGELSHSYGISPHAPYSLLLPKIRSALEKIPASTLVAMHIAESVDELDWLEYGSGPFKELFERLGIPIAHERASLEECISLLASRRRALLIHGNYLSNSQIGQLASAPSISVVYCPRTHAHFSHKTYPLQELRDAGIRVVLATDSRASNPDLSLWEEMVHVGRSFPEISPVELLQAITLGPAIALGVDRQFGSLESGKLAHVNVITCRPQWTALNLLESITSLSSLELGVSPITCLVAPS